MVKVIANKAEFDELISSSKPTVVDFWATWCGPCKIIGPHFAKLEDKYPGVQFAKVDIEEVGSWGSTAMLVRTGALLREARSPIETSSPASIAADVLIRSVKLKLQATSSICSSSLWPESAGCLAFTAQREQALSLFRAGGDVAQEQGIKAMPTFKAYKDGQVIDEFTGAVPAKLTVNQANAQALLDKISA
ncbi:thioredoxin (allergen cop c 2) [Trichosporon asahii var. asahii CBS 8904]|uniref:Thioredoxin (Allergen cop c 2) n=1 Tax=Trichosporon asahii var. asahii (strain CBS 8904) TaxID=1220162 RepID=K1VIV5_TRIAC|nr:thioredoxin (allergen cop c 2) [Trichosporon asahii var. asahii CBS 8904]